MRSPAPAAASARRVGSPSPAPKTSAPAATVVAKFLPGTTAATGFTATVDLGDGSVIPGMISPDPTTAGVYQVTVSHTYTGYGTFTLTV